MKPKNTSKKTSNEQYTHEIRVTSGGGLSIRIKGYKDLKEEQEQILEYIKNQLSKLWNARF